MGPAFQILAEGCVGRCGNCLEIRAKHKKRVKEQRPRNQQKKMASVKIPEQKVILCGEFGVGKSSLFRRFMSDTFTTATDRKSTMGLDHFGKNFKIGTDREIKLQLWDTGGMERVASIT